MIFSDEHIAKLRNYDFFKKDRLDAMNDGLRTVKAWGEYKTKPPYISFVVTTYKRPMLLKYTLESIIRQNYDDCEIIVVDNECADISEDTQTQQLIKNINNPKIVYFRNIDPMVARMDRAASLATGEWICFCHDDDMLAANHLETMLPIIKAHPEINFINSYNRRFSEKDFNKIVSNNFIANNRHDGFCRESSYEESVFFRQGSLLGGLIKRRLYEEMGGMPKISTNCGDMIMCSKFIYHYAGFFRIRAPLYFYRISNKQISSSKDTWISSLVAACIFYEYALTKLNNPPKFDYDKLCFSFLLKALKEAEQEWRLELDIKQIAEKCGIKNLKPDDNAISQYVKAWETYEKECVREKEKNGFEVYVNKVAKEQYL